MNKSDVLLKAVSALVFCAMVAYMAVYIVHRITEPVETALVVTSTMTDSSTLSGLVVRDELVISSDAPYINVAVSDGEKVGAGQTVAVVYSSEEALERAAALSALEAEIRETESALSATGVVSAAQSRDQSIYDAIIGLSASMRNAGFAGIDTNQSTLAGLIFRSDKTNATEEHLAALQTEYGELSRTSSDETEEIAVGQSGTYSAIIDGYEGIDPEYAKELSPSELREFISADRTVSPDAIGKLVLSYKWYYAAIVPRADASKLVAGRTVRLSFGRYYSDSLAARVEYVGQAEGNEQLVLFSMDRGFSEMMAVRAVSAEIIYSEYSGLRIPVDSLYRYYAGYLSEKDAQVLTEGETVQLSVGAETYTAFVSEIGSARRYGDLPPGVEEDSEEDNRPLRRLLVFCWPYSENEQAPDFSVAGALIRTESGAVLPATNYYEYNDSIDRMCVFSMTGLLAERKKVSLTFVGEEYALVESEGSDALREGNEVIVSSAGLFSGKVFR